MAISLQNSYKLLTWDISDRLVNISYFGKQDDSGRGIRVKIVQNGAYIVPSTETLRIFCEKPDGTRVYIDATPGAEHYDIKLTNQVYAVAGTVKAELQLNVGGEWITSDTFWIVVNSNLVDSSVISSDDFNSLQNALADVDSVKSQLADKANDAEVRKKSVPIGTNDISNDLASAITGGATLNVLSIPRQKSVTPEKTTFLEFGNNLFNKNDPEIENGFYLSQTGTHTANANLFISGKIAVEIGDIYSVPYINLIGDATSGAYYNENDEFVTYVTAVAQSGNTHRVITVPSNDTISYMRVNLRILFKDTTMVVKGNIYPSSYSEYKISLSNELKLNNAQKSEVSILVGGNPLSEKIVSFNGDSIMYGHGYVGGFAKIIADRNNMTYENIAVSGATITPNQLQSDGTTLRHSISGTINNMRDDADYIILEGGVNDSSLGVPMGMLTGKFDYTSTLNTDTFCGAFENMLKQTIARYPGKKIGFVITHKMLSAFEAYYVNMISALQKWGIPYCDLYVGIPSLNYIANLKTTYTVNADGWHPNELGYRKFYVDRVEAFMRGL
ncbi:MAG: hypothetical protein K0S76_426 [Herbinix sp.]|nr:hypothetical protein [Herbinix sp.]